MSNQIEQIKSFSFKKHDKFLKLSALIAGSSLIPTLISLSSSHFDFGSIGITSIATMVSALCFLGFAPIVEKTQKSKFLKLTQKYLNFNKSYLLDDLTEWAQSPSNIESITKHMLLALYLKSKNVAQMGYTHSIEEKNYSISMEHNNQLKVLIEKASLAPDFEKVFKATFEKDFKNDGLLGFAIVNHQIDLIHVMIKGLGQDWSLSEQDIVQIKKYSQFFYSNFNSEKKAEYNIDAEVIAQRVYDIKETLSLLLEENNYLKLPKDLRQYILENTDPQFLVDKKHYLVSLEKKIELQNTTETSLYQDIEAKKLEDKMSNQVVQPIYQEVNLSHSITSMIEQSHSFTSEQVDLLNAILIKSKTVSKESIKLSVEEQVEFKNYLEIVIPKYLQVFNGNDMNHEQIQQFFSTLSLYDNYLDSCLDNIKNHKIENFNVSDTYLQNKLQKYRKEIPQESEVSKKLKMNQ